MCSNTVQVFGGDFLCHAYLPGGTAWELKGLFA
jgi:hypothetical protein